MTLTFEKAELDNFIDDLEKWHKDRFLYVLTNVVQNYDPMGMASFRESRLDAGQVRGLIEKFDKLFEKEHPKPEWREMI